jgi:hypothetical protein
MHSHSYRQHLKRILLVCFLKHHISMFLFYIISFFIAFRTEQERLKVIVAHHISAILASR